MPFDPLDYPPRDPPQAPPEPMAPTDRHGSMVLALLGLVAVLLAVLIGLPYALAGLGRLADAIGP